MGGPTRWATSSRCGASRSDRAASPVSGGRSRPLSPGDDTAATLGPSRSPGTHRSCSRWAATCRRMRSTTSRPACNVVARMRRALATAVLLAALAVPPAAQADGDPASDVLLLQDAYTPYQPAIPKPVSDALNATLKQLRKSGYPLKVAIIATTTDLGAVPQFMGKPQPYASFLESEIAFNKPKALLVVMQNGYGTAAIKPNIAGALTKVPKPKSNSADDLGRAAIDGVVAIGQAAGHPVPKPALPASSSSGGGGGMSPAIIFGVPVLLLALGGLLAALRTRQANRTTS